ncbi:hypothetical protein ALP71_00260, partial [Pseudomonas coronafaciens pv. garcae]
TRALIGIIIVVNIVLSVLFGILGMEVPKALGTGLNIVFSLMYSLTANYSYYLKEVKGEQGWNPFKGMRL